MMNNKNHWHSNYEVGHDEIDNHHQELFDMTTMLDKALQNSDKSYLEHILGFLEHYVNDHFGEEELIMKESNFDEFDHHKHEHEVFKKDVRELGALFTQNCHFTHLVFKFRYFLDRLMFHIKTVDSKIKPLIKGDES